RDREERIAQGAAPVGRVQSGRQSLSLSGFGREGAAAGASRRMRAAIRFRGAVHEEALDLAAAHTNAPAATTRLAITPGPRVSCRARMARATSARARKSRDLTVPSGSSSARL